MNNRGNAAKIGTAPAFCAVVGDEAVTQVLKPIRQKFNVPAMAVAVGTSGGIKFVGAVGVRKRGTEIPVTLDDLWHLGSDGKAMTSTLVARLVERGQLKWDSTLAGVFPDLAPQMNPEFQKLRCSSCFPIGQVCRQISTSLTILEIMWNLCDCAQCAKSLQRNRKARRAASSRIPTWVTLSSVRLWKKLRASHGKTPFQTKFSNHCR